MVAEYGFIITRLVLDGPEVADAAIELRDGLNVISGPSNTGKTYISQCIDHVLGSGKPPESIAEAQNYDKASLTLTARKTQEQYSLSRSLKGGDISLLRPNGELETLKAKHSATSKDSVSSFLLGLCGLDGKKILKNKRGTTKAISFRDIARLTIIDEESIIKRRSPIHSGRPTDAPAEQSVLRLLLTGIDDSSVVETKEPKIQKAESRGKQEVLDNLETEARDKLAEISDSGESADEIKERRSKLDKALASLSASVEGERAELSSVDNKRRECWASIQRVESRQEVISQLRERFTLLSKQYASDLQRLESIAEVGSRLDELKEERCPVCGALAEHHSHDHVESNSPPDAIAAASLAESQKVSVLLSDLEDTLVELQNESSELRVERSQLEETLQEITGRLRQELRPRLNTVLDEQKELYQERSRLDNMLSFHERIKKIESLREKYASDTSGKADALATRVSASQAEELCKEIEQLLSTWKLPEAERVVFSEDAQDIVIAGRARSSDGKGVRAITHSAFTVALNNYCYTRKMPSSTVVLLDSPLVVYREPDESEEDFSPDVKASFYRSIGTESSGRQVIILENDEPPEDIDKTANVIHFTKSDHGRYGFIPLVESDDVN